MKGRYLNKKLTSAPSQSVSTGWAPPLKNLKKKHEGRRYLRQYNMLNPIKELEKMIAL